MFINISNHPSIKWNTSQRDAASQYGDIIDIGFPSIPAAFDTGEIVPIVEEYYSRILNYKDPVVMIQGEFVFTYLLVKKLEAAGIRAVAACSERVAEETIDREGNAVKQSVFRFVRFRDFY